MSTVMGVVKFVLGFWRMSKQLNESVRVICCAQLVQDEDDVSVVSRGKNTLIDFSSKYGDSELLNYLLSDSEIIKVHNECRKNYTSKRRLEQLIKRPHSDNETEVVQSKSLRSCSNLFDWKRQCFFCCKLCVEDDKHPDRFHHSVVQTLEIRESTLEMCAKQLALSESDVLVIDVQSRFMTYCDLVAEEALYHRKCHTEFFASATVHKVGHPSDECKEEAFEKLCTWLEETDCELMTC